MLRCWVSCALLILFAPFVSAQAPPPVPADGPARSEFRPPLIDQDLKLSDFAGMVPRAELRGKLAHLQGFVQNTPHDGQPSSEETEVWAARTRSKLYFVFLCHDRQPAAISGHMVRRDNLGVDDSVLIYLDTFQDRRKGVLFALNPRGVQADANWSEDNGADYSYDQVWDSEGEVTDHGWMALVAIPFRSLRFPRGRSNWGVVFERSIPRKSEISYWPRVAANVAGVLSQESAMLGMEDVASSHHLQFNPYGIVQNQHTLDDTDPSDAAFSRRALEGSGGGEFKAVFQESMVLDATVNPDFSIVESDQPQFSVNQRFRVFYPELRPFFLENSTYFNTPIILVYSRNILHPEFGARLTGKIDHTNLGLFVIDDRQPGEALPPSDPNYGKHALFSVARITEDVHKNSSIGLIYTGEEFGGGWNRLGGLDFMARLDKNWTLTGEELASSTYDPGSYAYSAGPAGQLEIRRDGRSLNLTSRFKDFSSGFQSWLGFLPFTNARASETHGTYEWFLKHKKINSIGLETDQEYNFKHSGQRLYRYLSIDPYFKFARQMVLTPIVGENSDTLGPEDNSALTERTNFTENYGGLTVKGAPWPALNFSLQMTRGGNVNYNPAPGQPPALLNQQLVTLTFQLQPTTQLTADNTFLLDRDFAAHGGSFVYESQTYRTKINYQFTRALSARVITEYDSVLANPAQSSLNRTKRIETQALLTWTPHPGTAVYAGYNNELGNIDRSLNYSASNHDFVRSPEWLNDGRQIFVKFSYLYRF